MNPLLEAPEPNFDHLISMTDERGTFEHALFSKPRPEHGYCTDDMARVLVVTTREPDPGPDVRDLAQLSMRFLLGALDAQGKCRNRLDRHGTGRTSRRWTTVGEGASGASAQQPLAAMTN